MKHAQRRRRRSTAAALAVLATGGALPLVFGSPAQAAVLTTSDAQTLAATFVDPSVLVGASFLALPPSGTPHGVLDTPLAGFPTKGGTAAILTSGDAALADDPNSNGSTGASNDGGNVRGDSDLDVSILKVDVNVPEGSNCLLGLDFRFLSDEFPEFVGGSVNDAFIAELDQSTWTTSGSSITAPDNFAFDPSGEVISINTSGTTSMTAAEAAGTTYDGATPILSASTPITPGLHSIFLSIFDQGDTIYDSAVFVDNLEFGTVANPATDCKKGAVVAEPNETLFGAEQGTSLVSFDRATPGSVTAVGAFGGLRSGEKIVGLDQRPATGELYALGSTTASAQLYKVNTATAALTPIGSPVSGNYLNPGSGFDFNPTVDRIRLVGTTGYNMRLHPDTGAVTTDSALQYAPGDSGRNASSRLVSAAGYTNNDNNPGTSTTLYDIDGRTDTLVIQAPPNAGTLTTVGPLGIDVNNRTNLDIMGADDALATYEKPGAAGSVLLDVDLATGAASVLGTLQRGGKAVTLFAFAAVTDIAPAPTA